MDGLLIKGSGKAGPRTEITRSFAFKLNLGNYQSADFFCAEKAECAIEDREAVAEDVYQFCKKQVMKAVSEYQIEQARKQAMQERRAS